MTRHHVEADPPPAAAPLRHCRACGCLARSPQERAPVHSLRCPRCGGRLGGHGRATLQTSGALLLAAAVLYVPANLMPVMSVQLMGRGQPDTIISGVAHLAHSGQWPLALIVFVASVVVPLLKLLALGLMLVTIWRRSAWRPRHRLRLYRVTEYIGRWSMVDIYVIAVLVGLVQFGNVARVEVNPGTVCFAAVVVLTMLSARSLDEHQLWAHQPPQGGRHA